MKGFAVMVELESVLLEAPLEAPLEEQVEAPLFQAWVPGNRGLYAKWEQMQSREAPLEGDFESPLENVMVAPLEELGCYP